MLTRYPGMASFWPAFISSGVMSAFPRYRMNALPKMGPYQTNPMIMLVTTAARTAQTVHRPNAMRGVRTRPE